MMNRSFRSLSIHLLLLLLLCNPNARTEDASEAIPVIFDTDLGNDCDDVLALGMLHALQSRGDCELLAVTLTKDHPLAASFADAVNTFYGRGTIPIGVCDSGVTPHEGKYNLLAKTRDSGSLRYEHDLTMDDPRKSAVEVLRGTLSSSADASVVVCQVGFSTNLANLLRSGPDHISEFPGKQLVAKKVRLLSIMAGAFDLIPNRETGEPSVHREYNVVKDIPSAQYLAEHWPTPVHWSGFEVGLNLRYPHQSIERDYDYVKHHPLAESYVLYNPPPHDRPTWDLTSVLHGVWTDRHYFDLSASGSVTIDDDGITHFATDPRGNDRYLIIPDGGHERITEAMVLLSSQPPRR
ncbi:MAG: nucleoside hydrolase [Planctomycetota bacterium]